ncbi:tetratricopeptide repeat protein [Pseudomonas sp. HMWF021]|uniref:tetratricopeptide repeat protein n=1 Tax=Pseudomonas sp. HMWF021 TaxID=2056857 RepID=UPI002115C638|nr:sel1 repeat family protein [Pseudomonas sp. HMWF021]
MSRRTLMTTRIIFNLLLLLPLGCHANTQITPNQDSAKQQGINLYNQYKATSAIPFLTTAAEAGDHEAQYYLGEALRKKNHYMNKEAKKWYEASAGQNDLYAMIQLGRIEHDMCEISSDCPPSQKQPIEWLNQAKNIAQEKAEAGDAEAMCIMYEITLDDTWLEKSASAGNAFAQYWMAVSIKQGDGFFLPWKRSEAVEKWFKLSAEGGYPKAMMNYAALLYERGDVEGYRSWVEKTALTGYATTVFGYGADLAHEPDTFGYPLDLIKGYALIYWLSELDGGGGMKENVEYTLPRIAAKMTAKQIEAAKKFSKEWAASHPPLSFFPDKLSR